MKMASDETTQRIVSLDVFRGFVMFWIVGADAFGEVFGKLPLGGLGAFLATQLGHTVWAGLTWYDLIFPSFVLVAGMSVPLSLDKIVEREGLRRAHGRILKRGALLFIIGVLYYGGLSKGFEHVRLLGVLQRLALCYVAGAYAHLYLKGKALPAVAAALLLVYWALLAWVPVPGFGAGDLARGHNLANWIDQHYLPGRLWYGDYDPEGLLSTLPALGSALIGATVGRFLRQENDGVTRFRTLLLAGLLLLAVGYLWSVPLPIIKRLWTSSFAVVAAGWGIIAYSIFYYVVDLKRLVRWSAPFQWIGSNALFIYLLSHLVNFQDVSGYVVGGPVAAFLNARVSGLGDLLQVTFGTLLCVLLCRYLSQKKIIIRL